MFYNQQNKNITTNFSHLAFHKVKSVSGFTLIETIISIAIFVTVIGMTYSVFSMSQKSYGVGSNEQELWQNARVALDRLTRELRQAADLVTVLPIVDHDELNPPPAEIEFQDGHDLTEITYIKYILNGSDIDRQKIAYYFSSDPDLYVAWNSQDEFSNPPEQLILEDNIIGQFFTDINFWGENKLINISIELFNKDKQVDLMTAVYGRNL